MAASPSVVGGLPSLLATLLDWLASVFSVSNRGGFELLTMFLDRHRYFPIVFCVAGSIVFCVAGSIVCCVAAPACVMSFGAELALKLLSALTTMFGPTTMSGMLLGCAAVNCGLLRWQGTARQR